MAKQYQEGADGSVNVQAGQNAQVQINNGLTMADALQIGKELARQALPELRAEANRVAVARATELAEDVLQRLQAGTGAEISSFAEPDIQYLLLAAQRDYARVGTEHLRKMLVDLLVARCQTNTGTLQAIVLAEAIETARKLTRPEICALTVAWFMTHVKFRRLPNMEALESLAKENIGPFIDAISASEVSYQHITYCGCGFLNQLPSASIADILVRQYPGLFQLGFGLDQIPSELRPTGGQGSLFATCLNDPTKYQVNALDAEAARNAIATTPQGNQAEAYVSMLTQNVMSPAQAEEILRARSTILGKLIDTWNNTPVGRVHLSSVGMAIAHSNWASVTGQASPLSTWIPGDES